MVHPINKRCFIKVSEVFSGTVNDVCVCRDQSSETPEYFMLWKIKEHPLARQILALQNQLSGKECFYGDGGLCFVLPYEEPRPLLKFYQAYQWNKEERQVLYRQIVELCLRESIPYPLLYLILKERKLNLASDRRLYFTYNLDLEGLDLHKTEGACVLECARILMSIMSRTKKEDQAGLHLMEQKAKRKIYTSFIELFSDLRIIEKKSIKAKYKIKLSQIQGDKKDRIFQMLLILVGALVVIAAMILISQIIFGDIFLFRLLENSFRRIGTESLL